jgi:hypothetical protein
MFELVHMCSDITSEKKSRALRSRGFWAPSEWKLVLMEGFARPNSRICYWETTLVYTKQEHYTYIQ